jgi:type VI secretion system protein ImpA
MAVLDVEALLAPVSTDDPCGPDLEYDAEMLALQQAAAGKAERAVGDTVVPAQEPEWRDVAKQCEALLRRTKHVGVAALLARAQCKQSGYLGAVQGLALVRGLIERYWDAVHPRLDPDDGSALMRLNTLALFTVAEDGTHRDLLREMGYAPLDTSLGRAGLRVRDLTLAFGAAKPDSNEAVPTEEGVSTALAQLLGARADLAQVLRDGQAHAEAIKVFIDDKAPSESPDLNALLQLTKAVADAGARVLGNGAASGEASAGSDSRAAASGRAVGTLRTREDCVRALDQVCEWFAQNEPSHPAPFVIQRAKRLVKMNFLEIIRDLAPNGLAQVEEVVGKETSSS